MLLLDIQAKRKSSSPGDRYNDFNKWIRNNKNEKSHSQMKQNILNSFSMAK